jgi:ABC-2 type transport system permease protein
LLLALTVLFVLFAFGLSYYVSELNQQAQIQRQVVGEVTTLFLISFFVGPVAIFIPIVAIAASYRSIAGERQSGSLKVLLSLPNNRAHVVVGKFLGRSGVVALALLVGFGMGLVTTAILAGDIKVTEYLVFVLASLLLGFAFVSISVGVSAFTASTSRAAYGAFGIFFVFQFLWDVIVTAFVYVANGFSLPGRGEQLPDWVSNVSDLLYVVDPTSAYQQGVIWTVRRISENTQNQGADAPFYAQDWFGFVFLLLWIALPLAVGYRRFESSDV